MQTSELKTQFFRRPSTPQHVVHEPSTPTQHAPVELWYPATAQPHALPQPVRRQRPFLKYFFLGVVLLGLLTVGFVTLAGAGLIYMSDLVLPGVTVNYPPQDRLPDPAQIREILNGPALSSVTTWGKNTDVSVSPDAIK